MLQTPLEQFQILSLINIKLSHLDFSFTNFLLVNLLSLISFVGFAHFNEKIDSKGANFYFIANSWQQFVNSMPKITAQLISDIIFATNQDKHFPFILMLLNFVLFSNLIGLIPYTFTTTSHLIVTFTLSFSVFIGINVITFQKHKVKIFSLFLPTNASFFLALLLVPIELVSYIAKPISLGVRLFINLMAGHSLLKVIGSFSWNMLLLENAIISSGLIIPMLILTLLFGLELGVALIQTYVFIILTCIYIQDAN